MSPIEMQLPSAPDQLLHYARRLVERLSSQPWFPEMESTVAILAAQKDILENQLDSEVLQARAGLINLDKSVKNIGQTISEIARYVYDQSNGNIEVLVSSGFEVYPPEVADKRLQAPDQLRIEGSPLHPGEICLTWGGAENAKIFVVQMATTDPQKSDPVWITAHVTTHQRVNITHLIHTRCYFFRVKAVNDHHESPYSEVCRFCACGQ